MIHVITYILNSALPILAKISCIYAKIILYIKNTVKAQKSQVESCEITVISLRKIVNVGKYWDGTMQF